MTPKFPTGLSNRQPVDSQSRASRDPVEPDRARQVGAASAAIPFGALKLEAMHLQLA